MNAAGLEELEKLLAFINRYAEALDVLVPNLANLECQRCGLDVRRHAARCPAIWDEQGGVGPQPHCHPAAPTRCGCCHC
jgi:hypothetical protein